MATDNRHRPGPAFRCPECRSHQLKVKEEVSVRRDSSARRKVKRRFRVYCPNCAHAWQSVHPHARDQFEAARKGSRIDYPRLLSHDEKRERGLV